MVSEVEERVRQPGWVRPVAAGATAAALFAGLCLAAEDLSTLASALMIAAAGACAYIALRADSEVPAPLVAPRATLVSGVNEADAASAILEGLTEPALLIDAQSRILAANAAARRHLQMQSLGSRLSSVLRRPELLDAAQAATESKRASAVDYETLGPVEEHFKVLVAPIALNAGAAALIVFHDQTAAINTEQMRVEFLANASHELRTPLASLTLLIETLGGHAKDDPDARERFLPLMQVQAERMKRLIDDLLSLSKIELNEHVPPSEHVDLVQLAKEITDTLAPIASDRGVKLALQLNDKAATVVGDRFQLTQVAQNLVDNAIKYSPKGSSVDIEVGVAATREEAAAKANRAWMEASRFSMLAPPPAADRGYAYLRVADHGPGIGRHHLPRLSERFFRVEREEKADHSGTGLGLAIVKHIVNRHRGGFTVESEPGRGSAFAIYLEQPGPDLSL